jgi:hypothetical protein
VAFSAPPTCFSNLSAAPPPAPFAYAGKIPFESAPEDDRQLPDLHLALYNDVVVLDQATKVGRARAC